MPARLKSRPVLVSLPLATGLLVAGLSTPAFAVGSIECIGELGAIDVNTDLVVPSGETCDLNGTEVTGNITVEADADLYAEDAFLGQDGSQVTVARNGYLEVLTSFVEGDIRMQGSYGLYAERSVFDGMLQSRRTGFIYIYDSSVDGDVDVRRDTEFTAEFVDVDGRLLGQDVEYLDLYDSTVDGALWVEDASSGSYLCSTKLESNVRFKDNASIVHVGGEGAATRNCGGNIIEGSLQITDSSGDVVVTNNLVQGDLTCRYNDVAPVGSGNRVRGEMRGQCQDLAPAIDTATKSLGQAEDTKSLGQAEDRRGENRARAKDLASQRRP